MPRAIAPSAEIDEIGIRPGEKLHEVLISEDEARNTVEGDRMFIVKPPETLWERSLDYDGRALPAGFRYSSDTNSMWLDVQGIRELIAPFEQLEATDPSQAAGRRGPRSRAMRLLVTGASGLLGLNLALEAARLHDVIGVSRRALVSTPFESQAGRSSGSRCRGQSPGGCPPRGSSALCGGCRLGVL